MSEEEKEPQIDESLLTPKQKEEMEKPLFPKKAAIFMAVILALMVVCLIVLAVVR